MTRFDRVFEITGYGAIADGKTDNTKAIQAALDACAASGGGTVVIPSGVFCTGSILLSSHTTLYLENSAVLSFRDEIDSYPLIETYSEGRSTLAYRPLIFADGAEQIAITGMGTLDGKGAGWWDRHRKGALAYPRPRFIGFQHCRHVLIEQVKICNSPSWTISPVYCSQVLIDKVKISNPPDSPNTDGINPDSCQDVQISNCHIDVGDDCIALKAGQETREPKVPCENIVITNCIFMRGHGGVVIGSEMSGGVRNVAISNCVFQGTDRGIRIKTRRFRGGLVENICISNSIMEKVICPLVINMRYRCGTTEKDQWVYDETPYPIDEKTPIIRKISLSHLMARDVHAAALFLEGLPEMPLQQISLSDVVIEMALDPQKGLPAMMYHLDEMAGKGMIARHVKDLSFFFVRTAHIEGQPYQFEQCQDVRIYACNHK